MSDTEDYGWSGDEEALLEAMDAHENDLDESCSHDTTGSDTRSEPEKVHNSSIAVHTGLSFNLECTAISRTDGGIEIVDLTGDVVEIPAQPHLTLAEEHLEDHGVPLVELGDAAAVDHDVVERPLTFHIPREDLKAALKQNREARAKLQGPQRYWDHTLYRGSKGEMVTVHYCQTLEESQTAAQIFTEEKVIGFDMEWVAWGKNNDIKKNVSMIQIASERDIALFHVALHKGETVDDLIAPALRAVIESESTIMTGVNIIGDARRLKRYTGIYARGMFELSRMYKTLKYSSWAPERIDHKNISLAQHTEEHLRLPLSKDNTVRCGKWDRPLEPRQKTYAASDAYAGFMLYEVMDRKRKQMRPTPPRPDGVSLSDTKKTAATREDPADRQLRQSLQRWRERTAKERDLQLNSVLLHSHIDALIRKRPTDVASLLLLSKFTKGKADRYGAELLAIVARHPAAKLCEGTSGATPSARQALEASLPQPLTSFREPAPMSNTVTIAAQYLVRPAL
ncbi:hypothetical protein LTR66_008898 [Elasticomyces elasticus]|nr:hypothetical protein LTR66_008898 [Elasticomyces elasticus]